MKIKLSNKTVGIILISAGVVLVALTIFRLTNRQDGWVCDQGIWVKHGQPQSDQPNTDCKKGDQVNDSKQPEPAKLKGKPLGILITSPIIKAKITNPVVITGTAKAENFIHNAINFKIIDKTGNVFGEGSSAPGIKQKDGNFAFETSVNFTTATSGLGFIMINDNVNYKFPIEF